MNKKDKKKLTEDIKKIFFEKLQTEEQAIYFDKKKSDLFSGDLLPFVEIAFADFLALKGWTLSVAVSRGLEQIKGVL